MVVSGYVALINEDIDAALDFFGKDVERGSVGHWTFGTPVLFPRLMASDARFDPILERIKTNRDRQLAELQRLRASGMDVAEVREEYLLSQRPDSNHRPSNQQ